MSRTARILDDYLDKSFVYSALLNKSHSYYGRLKTVFKIPVILTSSVMSVINGNIENGESLKIVNITFNLLTAILLGLTATLKFEEKYQNFLSTEKKFLKLSSKIEQKLLNENEIIITEFVNEIINEYDMIVDNLDYDIPVSICKSVRAQYATKKTLPMIINGVSKEESNRSPKLKNVKTYSFDDEKTNKCGSKTVVMNTILEVPDIKSSISYKEPVVLNIKKIEEEYGVFV